MTPASTVEATVVGAGASATALIQATKLTGQPHAVSNVNGESTDLKIRTPAELNRARLSGRGTRAGGVHRPTLDNRNRLQKSAGRTTCTSTENPAARGQPANVYPFTLRPTPGS